MFLVKWFDFSPAYKDPEKYIALVASLSHGKSLEDVDPQKLTQKLIDLGHESVFEFIRYPEPYNNARVSGILPPAMFPPKTEDELRATYGTVRLTVPIYVARQIMRHRSFSYLELSRRYTKPPRVDVGFSFPLSPKIEELKNVYGEFYNRAKQTYISLLTDYREPAQFARAVLPLGTLTMFWMQGDYKAWGNFLVYRLHPAAQVETRKVAQEIWNSFLVNQPILARRIANYVLRSWVNEAPEIFQEGRRKHLKEVKDYFKAVSI